MLRESGRRKVTSVDKANVLATFQFWREVVTEVHADYADVALDHMYVDNAAMQLVKAPKSFDVIADRQYVRRHPVRRSGDADRIDRHAAVSVAERQGARACTSRRTAVRPTSPGKGIANPLATILSAAMMLRHSLNLRRPGRSDRERRSSARLAAGARTQDIWSEGTRKVGTREMGDAVIAALR